MLFNNKNALIYIVDDDFSICDSLKTLLESKGRLVKYFQSAEGFLNNYDPAYPGCLLLDVSMPLMSGLELQQELSKINIHIPIIFISGNSSIQELAKAFRAGALDFLEKPFNYAVLLKRIDEAIEKDIENKQKMHQTSKVQAGFDRLTAREKEVLQLIVSNHSNKESARILNISHRTIDAHRARVMEKMQAENVTALVSMVMNNNLLNSPLKHQES